MAIKKISVLFVILLMTGFISCQEQIINNKIKEKTEFINVYVLHIINEKEEDVFGAKVQVDGITVDSTDYFGISIFKTYLGRVDVQIKKEGYEVYSKKIEKSKDKNEIVIKIMSLEYYQNRFFSLIEKGMVQEAAQIYSQHMVNINGDMKVKKYFLVLLYYHEGNYNKAYTLLDELYNIYDDDLFILTRGKLLINEERFDEGIGVFEQLIQKNRIEYYYLYKTIGDIYYFQLKNKPKAKEYYLHYLEFKEDGSVRDLINWG